MPKSQINHVSIRSPDGQNLQSTVADHEEFQTIWTNSMLDNAFPLDMKALSLDIIITFPYIGYSSIVYQVLSAIALPKPILTYCLLDTNKQLYGLLI